MATAFIFPGQGSQDVGMGKALAEAFPAARAVFDEVDDALGERLSNVMFDGPKDTLTLTANAQPALMAVSVAATRILESEFGLKVGTTAKFVAGHSLGEYSALVSAGSLQVADAARLLRLRGSAMQEAVPVGAGGMIALLGCGLDAARAIAAEAADGDVLDVANDNEPAQVVLSGHKTAIERVPAVSKSHGVRRAIPLPVSAPFHCSLMQPAADVMAEALANIEISKPVVELIPNVSVRPTADVEVIRQGLVEQVTATVRWRETVAAMKAAGVTRFVELGAGKVLAGLVRRTMADGETFSVGTPDDFAAVVSAFQN
ncbi:MAG: ACP S-malonyltransferase [Pseudomonadota bacterium]